MHKRPTLADVARHAGVSKPAVSQVLNRHPQSRISTATRERVEKAAAELGYQPNHIALSLVRGTTSTIGVIVPDLKILFYAGIVDGMEEAAAQSNHRLLLAHSRHDTINEARLIDTLLDHRVDGIICMSSTAHKGGGSRWLTQEFVKRVPCVLIDESQPEVPIDTVTNDDRGGALLATEHLIQRGHKRIAFVGANSARSSACDRLAGYREALTRARIPVRASLEIGRGYDVDAVADILSGVLDSSEKPTAVVAANDYLAMAVIDVARTRNIAIGTDLAIVGYSNDPVLARALQLTSIDQSPAQLGRLAIERLLARIADRNLRPKSMVVPTSLVIRASSGS